MMSACSRVCVILAFLIFSISADESDTYRGPDRPVDAAYFGMHMHHAADGTAWPAVEFADWRLWDAGVAWPQLEPQRNQWNFVLLDRYVHIAAEHHVEILLTLGLTPAWASARPNEPSAYGKGNAAEPRDLQDWQDYVRAVATRYKGVIHNYEVWNEPNVKGTFTGSGAAMLELARATFEVVKSVDSTAIVVSPSATSDSGVAWLDDFLDRGGCRYSDVIGYHFYVTPAPPEAMASLISKVKKSLQARGCATKPLWNTESGWAQPKSFSSASEAASYLMRTYVLNWLMGVDRCYWYAWDNHNWSTLDLTTRHGDITPAGASYGVIRKWLLGSIVRSCNRERSGAWVCQLDGKQAPRRILWSDGNDVKFRIPASWRPQQETNWLGDVSVTTDPLLVSSTPLLLTAR
jgi:hypothetical protein